MSRQLGALIVSAAEVDGYLARVDIAATSLFADIAAAPVNVAGAAFRADYARWYVAWRSFVAESAPGLLDKLPPFLVPLPRLPRALASIYEATARWQVELEAWIERFKDAGGIVTGMPLAPAPVVGTSDIQGTIRTVAIGGAVVVGALALVYMLSFIPVRR